MNGPKRVFRSTRKVSGGAKTYRKWEEWEIGEIVIGKYVDDHLDQYKKQCPVIEVVDAMLKDDALNKSLQGKLLVLNHCGQLRKAFDKIEKEQLVQVTYNGKSLMEKGPYAGKDAHLIGVEEVVEDGGGAEQEDEVEL